MARVTQTVDHTLLWALRIVGLLALAVLIYVAAKVLVGAILVLVLAVGVVILGFVLVRRIRPQR